MTTRPADLKDVEDEIIREFLDRLRKRKGRDHGTYKRRRSDLRKFDRWLFNRGLSADSDEITTLLIEDFVFELNDEGYSGNSIETIYASVRSFYQNLVDRYDHIEIDKNPAADVPMADIDFDNNGKSGGPEADSITYITKEEKDRLLEHAPPPKVRNKLLIELLFQTGIRRGEASNIELEHIDLDNRKIDIYGEKSNEWRVVKFQPSLKKMLKIWIDHERPLLNPGDSDRLFITERKGHMSYDMVNHIVREAASNAGLNEVVSHDKNGRPMWKITAHTLRHSHAVHALKCDIDVRSLQKHLGHSKIETTMEYLQLIDSDVLDAFDAKFE
jgi:integrase/recombinase XerD